MESSVENGESAPQAKATPASSTTSDKGKGKRTTLSLHEKSIVKTFCEQQLNESKARADFVPSHDTLRQEIATKFGWELGRSTLSKIVGMEWKHLQIQDHPNPNMKRKRKPLFPAFEADLVKSIHAYTSTGLPSPSLLSELDGGVANVKGVSAVLTEALILEEAQRLKQIHGIKDEELILSVGWLARFKHRNGIRLRKPTLARTDGTVEAVSDLPAVVTQSDHDQATMKRPRTHESSSVFPGGWQSGFHFTPSFNGGGSLRGVDHAFLLSTAFADLRINCVVKATQDSDHQDMTDSIPTAVIDAVPDNVRSLSCPHCAVSVPLGIKGLNVVVIGLNCVRDAFVAAALVGERGSVTCIETNLNAAEVAESHVELYTTKTLDYASSNLHIVRGSLVDDGASYSHLLNTRDLVIFNCSFHTTVHKTQLIEAAFNLLKEGGECRLSYARSSRRTTRTQLLQLHSATDAVQLALHELASSAVYAEDFRRMCQHLGFLDPRVLRVHQAIHHDDQELAIVICRLFKLRLVEDRPEDYGEQATNNGGNGDGKYRLDLQFVFAPNVAVPVDGNTAQILRVGWLKSMFIVEGDRSTHRGRFIREEEHQKG